MKLVKNISLILLMGFSSIGAARLSSTDGESLYLKQYINDSLSETSYNSGVYLQRSDVNLGYSKVLAGYEHNELASTNNKFIRLANFNGISDINESRAIVLVSTMKKVSEVNYSFSYRFYQGKANYNKNDIVLTISYRGASKTYTYDDLVKSTKSDPSFNVLEGTLSTSSSVTSNDFKISFNYKNIESLSNPSTYIDIDNVNVSIANNNYCLQGDMEDIDASNEDTLVNSVDLVNDNRDLYENLILNNEEIDKYHQNSKLGDTIYNKFEYYDTYYKLPRGGSTSKPLAVSSAAANSSLYLLHSNVDDNSFMRLRNYDGTNNEATILTIYYYDNENNVAINMPSTSYVYYSFKYRLYMDDIQQEKYYQNASPLLFFSTRHASTNNSGNVYLQDLIINDNDDKSWRTHQGIIDVRATTNTNNLSLYYYHLMNMGDNSSYFDIDDLYISNVPNAKNYVYGNGEFNFDLDNNKHPISGETGSNDLMNNVINNYSLGNAPSSQAGDNLTLKCGNNVSYLFDNQQTAGAYYIDIKGTNVDKLNLRFDGLSGESYNFDNKNQYFDYKLYDGGLRMYLSAGFGFNSIDFTNNSLEDITLDSFSISKINSVNVISGDYTAFTNSYNDLIESVDASKLTKARKRRLDAYMNEFNTYNTYSSQELLDGYISRLTSFITNDLVFKSDLSLFNIALDNALNVLLIKDELTCSPADYIIFDNLVREAMNVTDEDSQTYVDELTNSLTNATKKVLGEE